MKFSYKKINSLLVVAIILLFGCEEVVNPDLPSSSSIMVIDGWVSDQPAHSYVFLSLSQSYNNTRPFVGITGARVEVQEEGGDSVLFEETDITGEYRPPANFIGVPSKVYNLRVSSSFGTAEASCLMPAPPELKGIGYDFVSGNLLLEEGYYPAINLLNQAGIQEYFFWKTYLNGTRADPDKVNVIDDLDFDGQLLMGYIIYEQAVDPLTDTTTVEFSTLSEMGYRYYKGLKLLTEVGSPSQAIPENPPSNVTGAAIGFFNCSSTIFLTKTP